MGPNVKAAAALASGDASGGSDLGGKQAATSAGIFNTGGNIPPYAVFVVKVADVAATAARAEELGGKVVVAPNKLEDGMVVAYLTDLNGSLFALFSPRPES